MLARHANRTFALALMLSLALHALLVLTMPNPLGGDVVAAVPISKPVKVRLTAPLPPPASQPEEPKKEEPKEERPKEIELGLDAPAPPSPTWLGYTEYVKQLMAKSAVEQAAFTDDPVAASPPPTPPSPPTPPEQQPAPPTPPIEQPAETPLENPPPESPDAERTVAPDDDANAPQPPPAAPDETDQPEPPTDEHSPDGGGAGDAPAKPPEDSKQPESPDDSKSDQPQDQPSESTPQVVDSSVIALANIEANTEANHESEAPDHPEVADLHHAQSAPDESVEDDRAAEPPPATSFIEAMTELAAQALAFAEQAAISKPDETKKDEPRPTPPQPQAAPSNPPPPIEPQPVVAREQKVGAPNDGAQSDRESDPSSTVDVPRDQWQLGKPLAAHGLEVKPRRPTMPLLTTLTAWPANPICKVCFDRTGVPKRATLIRSTGDERVDSAIEASLYRWRASGKPLETLRGDQTFDITIRLLINPARKNEDKDG